MASGIEHPNVIDIITKCPDGSYGLIIVGPPTWSGSGAEQALLIRKFEMYLAYVQSGEFYEAYPDAIGRTVHFQVDSFAPVPGNIEVTLKRLATYLAAEYAIEVLTQDLSCEDPNAE